LACLIDLMLKKLLLKLVFGSSVARQMNQTVKVIFLYFTIIIENKDDVNLIIEHKCAVDKAGFIG
jgi:hypothetical protein